MKSLFRSLLLLAALWSAQAFAAPTVWVVADPEDPYHRGLIQALSVHVWPAGLSLAVRPAAETVPSGAGAPELLITLGEAAASRHAAWPGPVLHAFLTEAQFGALYPRGAPRDHTALFLEQPLARQVALVRAALPHVTSLLVPVTGAGREELQPLRDAAARAGLTVREAGVATPQELDGLLAGADAAREAVLFLPDPALRSNTMIKVALLGAYKRRLPLVAYSEGLVMAGALAAVHTTVPLLAEELIGRIEEFAAGGRLAPPALASRFDVSVNYQLAKSLNLRVPAKAVLMQEIREVSHGP